MIPIISINSIIFLFLLLPDTNFKYKKFYRIFISFFVILFNSVLVFSNLLDSEYFSFTYKRSTADIFSMLSLGNDVQNLLPVLFKDYWYVLVTFIIFIFCFVYVYFKAIHSLFLQHYVEKTYRIKLLQSIISIFILALLFIIYRGVGLKPVTINTASQYTDNRNIPLLINTPFSLMFTFEKDELPVLKYSSDSIVEHYTQPIKFYRDSLPFDNKNVIVLILESFSQEYIGAYSGKTSYTPFFDSLISVSYAPKFAFANGKKSIEAMPAVVAGIPTLMDNPYLSSQYATNRINSLANILREMGYYTAFYHGGNNGTMGFDYFAYISGFQHYKGKNEYPNPADYDGQWGVWDEPYLQYFCKELTNIKQPFFTCLFTLSSHHPYLLPEQYKDRFSEGKLPIHKTIRYSDFALKRFFESAKKSDWYKNTLFVLVADHTAQSENVTGSNLIGTYEIPIVYFSPSDSSFNQLNRNIITQQIDILPSVLDYLNYEKPFFALGNSVFSKCENRFAISYMNAAYQMITPKYVYGFEGQKFMYQYDWRIDKRFNNNLILNSTDHKDTTEMTQLKYLLQTYTTRVKNNRLVAE